MQSKHTFDGICANRTCRAPVTKMTAKGGQPRQFCSRACQLAARNPTHRKTLQVEVNMDTYHAMVAEARLEGESIGTLLQWALDSYLMES